MSRVPPVAPVAVAGPAAPEAPDASCVPGEAMAPRKRPKPGERRVQILQALATLLEAPQADRITTAVLAARLQVSEAALYRHFASKAQMYEGLIGFIEDSVFGLVQQVLQREADPGHQVARIVAAVLQFAEKNPGMGRVMAGDALLMEHPRLQARVLQLFDRLESSLRQPLRTRAEARGSLTPTVDAQAQASVAVSLVLGRVQRHARTGFQRLPTEHLDATLRQLLA